MHFGQRGWINRNRLSSYHDRAACLHTLMRKLPSECDSRLNFRIYAKALYQLDRAEETRKQLFETAAFAVPTQSMLRTSVERSRPGERPESVRYGLTNLGRRPDLLQATDLAVIR